MAELDLEYMDSPVYIYDTDSNLITNTTVIGHDRELMCIEVAEGLEGIGLGTTLSLLIVHSSGVCELSGTLEDESLGIYRVALREEHRREVRTSARHVLNASAVISDMITGAEQETINKPLPVTIENMSKTGILINAQDMDLDMGTLLQIEFKVGKKTGIIYGEIVRFVSLEDGAKRYGCQLYFFEK